VISAQSVSPRLSLRNIHRRSPWCGDAANRLSARRASTSAWSARKCNDRPQPSHRGRGGEPAPLKIANRRRPTRNSGRPCSSLSSAALKAAQISLIRRNASRSSSSSDAFVTVPMVADYRERQHASALMRQLTRLWSALGKRRGLRWRRPTGFLRRALETDDDATWAFNHREPRSKERVVRRLE
jgi:hypothetical protein